MHVCSTSKNRAVGCLGLAGTRGPRTGGRCSGCDSQLGVVVVLINRLEPTSGKLQKLAGKVGGPPVSLLMLARMQTGIQEGLDDKGTAGHCVLPADGQPAAPIVVLPVTDYAKFLAQLKPKDAKAKIAEVTLGVVPALVCQRGKFAVLAQPEGEAALEAVLAADKSIAEDLKPLGNWLTKVDLVAVVMLVAVRMVGDWAQRGDAADRSRSAWSGCAPTSADARRVSTTSGRDCRRAADGGDRSAVGRRRAMRTTIGVRFSPKGKWGATAARMADKSKDLLAGLPADPLVAAAALQFSAPLTELADALFGPAARTVNPVLANLEPAEQEKFGAAAKGMWARQQTERVWIGATKPGEPLSGRASLVSRVDDSKQFLTELEEAWNQMKLPMGDDPERLVPGVIRHKKVDDRKVLEIVGSPRQIDDYWTSWGPAGKATAIKLLGPPKEVHGYVAAIDEKTIVWAYGGEENLRGAIAAAEQTGSKSAESKWQQRKRWPCSPMGRRRCCCWSCRVGRLAVGAEPQRERRAECGAEISAGSAGWAGAEDRRDRNSTRNGDTRKDARRAGQVCQRDAGDAKPEGHSSRAEHGRTR